MAERRMFSKRVVRSARFLKMPSSSRDLYWQLGIEADDDGIVEAFNVMRLIGASEDDLRVLVAKNFVQILNDDLVAYITDWNENNRIRADRKIDSIYKDLLLQLNPEAKLVTPKPRADTKKLTGHSLDNQWTSNGQRSIGKESIVEISEVEVKVVKEKEPYFANAELNSIFLEFIEVRKKLKAVNSDRAIKTLINKLNKYSDDVKYQMIENSIVNSWKDVYELKEKRTTSYNSKPVRQEIVPDWINQKIEKEPMTPEELAEIEKEFAKFKTDEPKSKEKKKEESISYQEYLASLNKKEEYKPNPELQKRLKEKYGKKQNV